MLTDYHQALHLWYKTSLGQRVWDTVCREVSGLTVDFFGRRLLVVGTLDITAWLSECPISESIYLADSWGTKPATVCGNVSELPFADNSFDAVIIPYALEWQPHHHELILELGRVLMPQGNMLIVGFNPMSLWGLVQPWQKEKLPPFHGHLLRIGHIRHDLAKAECAIAEIRTCYYGLPSSYMGLAHAETFETLGRLGWPSWGAVYVVHAHKQITPLTPIRPKWSQRAKWVDSPAWVKS